MIEWDEEKVLANIREADTEDLLDRVTAYRAGMEAEAIDLVEMELRRRDVGPGLIQARLDWCEQHCIYDDSGCAKMCSQCRRPAVGEEWRWHKILGMIPVFPRWMTWCEEHR